MRQQSNGVLEIGDCKLIMRINKAPPLEAGLSQQSFQSGATPNNYSCNCYAWQRVMELGRSFREPFTGVCRDR
jgi:hypothetical protein